MKKLLLILLLSASALAQTAVQFSRVPLFSNQPATASASGSPVTLPVFGQSGQIIIFGAGITGSPVNCNVALQAGTQGNVSTFPVTTVAFTPANGITSIAFTLPSSSVGDVVQASYYCGTYPASGSISVSLALSTRVEAIIRATNGFVNDYDSGIAVLPTSSTAATSTTTLVHTIFCTNVTGTAATATITDNQGSPVTYVSAFSIAANSNVQFINSPKGLKFLNGIKWSSGTASAINCQIAGLQ